MSMAATTRRELALIEARARQLRDILARRAKVRCAVALARLAAGFPLCFVGPLVLGTLFWFISGQLIGWNPWWWFVGGLSVLMIPLLFRMEFRTGGDYLGSVSRDPGPQLPGGEFLTGTGWMIAGMPGMIAANAAAAPRTASAGLVEVFLLGPRMMVSGARHLRNARRLRAASLDRAVAILWQLVVHEQGVPLERLPVSRDERAEVAGALAWLAFYDWIGIGEKGAKAILFGDSRKHLAARLGELSG